MNTEPVIEDFPDAAVEEGLDRELRELLSTCFTKAGDEVFRRQRFYREMPVHRWVMRDEAGKLAAHLAVHEKTVIHAGGSSAIGGIAEVCVHPSARGRGSVRRLVAAAEAWLAGRGAVYGVLFGDLGVYASSGYRAAGNLVMDVAVPGRPMERRMIAHALVKALGAEPWPAGEVYLPGERF